MKKTGKLVGVCNCGCHCDIKCFTEHNKTCVHCSRCKHTKQPTGYMQWHAWAKKMSNMFEQIKCPNCGLYAIWKAKNYGKHK